MAYKFNTGNPVGPNGSADPRDLVDNAQVADRLITSTELSVPDRLGVARKTWAGMEQDFQQFLINSGYQFLGDYAAGVEVTAYNQVIRDGGEFWRVAAGTSLPYMTTGAGMPEGGAFVSVGDAVLRQDLDNPDKGAAMASRGVVAVDSIADLLALPEGQRKADLRYLVKGYHTGSDVGGGEFYFSETDSTPNNDGTVFVADSGVFLRKLDDAGTVTPRMFGIPDSTEDPANSQTAAFSKMLLDSRVKQIYFDADYKIGGPSVISSLRFIGPGSINKLQVAGSDPLPGTILPRPSWFTWNTGVLPRYLGNGKWQAVNNDGTPFNPRSLDTASLDPNKVQMFVDKVNGDELNNGLTPQTAVQTLERALARADVGGYSSVVIYMMSGFYDRRDYISTAWLGAGRNLSIRAVGGPVYLVCSFGIDTLTFTEVTTGSGEGSYKAARNGVATIWDSKILDENGYWTELAKVTSLSNLVSGSWYTDGTDIWVMPLDRRAPDADIHIMWDAQRNVWSNTNGNLYCEGVHFIGGTESIMLNQDSGYSGRVVLVDGGCMYSQTINGFKVAGGESWLINCKFWRNMRDNINYHANAALDNVARAVEINCFSDKAGRTNGEFSNNNASTGHNGAFIQRIGGEYMRSEGPNVIDVVNCRQWNAGSFAHDSEHPDPGNTTDTDFYVNDSGIMRLDYCKAGGSSRAVTVFYSQGAQFECSGWQGPISILEA